MAYGKLLIGWEYPVLCSNYGSIPDEETSQQHLFPLIPAVAWSNFAACRQAFILLKVHTDSCCRSTCRRSAVNLQVVLSKAHPVLGWNYAILYN
jgi:hypothetical protein